MRIRSLGVAVAVAVVVLAGCSGPGRQAIEPCSSDEVLDLVRMSESLGSSDRLVAEFATAAEQRTESVTMGEMTVRAGWSSGWDRAVWVGPGSTADSVNADAGTDIGSNCLQGLPQGGSDSNGPAYPTYTLFVSQGVPVQAVMWREPNPDLRIGRAYLVPDSELKYVETIRAMSGK
ncbi:hypothetical protein ACFVVM_30900 [Nocardia sp. NPDC058176]|uniref:hypothetical protein n=1 Tax=Nocardia sp. NPDC058176 TaxID=3346368 RepID=UPI0036DDC6D2